MFSTHIFICMWEDMFSLHSTKTESNDLKFGTFVMLSVRFLQPMQTLSVVKILGAGGEVVGRASGRCTAAIVAGSFSS